MAKPSIHLRSIVNGAANNQRRSIDARTISGQQRTVHSTQYTAQSTQYLLHGTESTVTANSIQYIVHSSQYMVLSASAQYTPRSTQYTVQRTLRYEVQITSLSMCGSVCVSIS